MPLALFLADPRIYKCDIINELAGFRETAGNSEENSK
jgi:hypothetical protein